MCTKYTLFTQICCNNFGVPAYNARCTLDGYSFRVIRLFFFSKVLCTKNDTLFLESISHMLVNMKPPIHFSKHCKRIKKNRHWKLKYGKYSNSIRKKIKNNFFFRNMDVIICMSNTCLGFFNYEPNDLYRGKETNIHGWGKH